MVRRAPHWCKVVRIFRGQIPMVAGAKRATKARAASKSVRMSVSLPRELHETLSEMAKGKKVTVAWVIRDAAEKYVGDQWPLFKKGAA